MHRSEAMNEAISIVIVGALIVVVGMVIAGTAIATQMAM